MASTQRTPKAIEDCHELFSSQSELKLGHYQPGEYRQFTIYDRKPRNISAAPFRDRVVHHALRNI